MIYDCWRAGGIYNFLFFLRVGAVKLLTLMNDIEWGVTSILDKTVQYSAKKPASTISWLSLSALWMSTSMKAH